MRASTLLKSTLLTLALFAAPYSANAYDEVADQTLISSNQKFELQGNRVIDLARIIDLRRVRGSKLNSVIIIASSKAGMGQVGVLLDGRMVEQRRVGRELDAVQIDLRRGLNGRDLFELQIQAQGNINIAMVGVTLEDGWDRDDRRDDGRGRGRGDDGRGGGRGPGRHFPGAP